MNRLATLPRTAAALLITLFLLCTAQVGLAARTAAGTEFIFPVTPQGLASQGMQVLIAADTPTTVTVSVPGLGFSEQVQVVPGTVARVKPPVYTWYDLKHDTVINRSVHVTAPQPVKVFVEHFVSKSSDAFLALPLEGLGKRYRAVTYIALFKASLTVTATEDDTRVTITPSDDTPGRPAHVPFEVVLDRFESYHLAHRSPSYHFPEQVTDLTGTLIEADKPVAVGSGNACTFVPYKVPSCDHLTEMMPPVEAWGKRVMTAPLASRLAGDLIRIMADEDDTVVFRNGEELARLAAGEYVDTIVAEPSLFESAKPILVTQYSLGQAFDRTATDPFMMLAVPAEQYLDQYTVSTAEKGFSANYLGVVVPAPAADSLVLDGGPLPPVSFTPVPGTDYLVAAVPVSLGSHQISADAPFGLYVYGFDRADSYGYPGGMGLERINGKDSDFSDVVLDVVLPLQGAHLVEGSFSRAPDVRNDGDDGSVLTWRWDGLSVGEQQSVAFDMELPAPVPGEQREMISDVQLAYRDLAGTTHQRTLGPQTVAVLDTWLDSYLQAAPASVPRGDAVTLTAGLESLSDIDNGVAWQLTVEDAAGALVGLVAEGEASMAAGSAVPLADQLFDSSGLYGGEYRAVLAAHAPDGTLLTRSDAAFTIEVAPASAVLAGRLSLDQIDYQVGDTLSLDVRLANDGVGQILSGLQASVSITGGAGEVWSDSYAVDQLVAGAADLFHAEVALASWQPGDYSAELVVRDASGAVVYTEQDSFMLVSSADSGAGVSGQLALSSAEVLRTGTLGISASVTNDGNSALAGVPLRLLVLDAESGEVVDEFGHTLASLAQQESASVQRTWYADVPAEGVYVVSLVAVFPQGERPLDFVPFTVRERFGLGMSFAAPGKVLVLMDPAECEANAVTVTVTPPTLMVSGDVLDISVYDGQGALLDSERHQVGVDTLPLNTSAGSGLDLSVDAVQPDALTLLAQSDGSVAQARITVALQRGGDTRLYESAPFSLDCNSAEANTSLFRFAPVPAAGTQALSAERLVLERALTDAGWRYHIVTSASAFEAALASGAYPMAALFNARVKIPEAVQRDVQNAVANGLSLLAAGAHDMRNGRITEALGVKIMGKLPKASGWQWQDGWLPAGDNGLDNAAFPLRIEPTTARAQAVFSQRGKGAPPTAVAHADYGYGHSAFMAFDVLAEMVAEGDARHAPGSAEAWLLASLEHLRPASTAPEAGSTQQVNVQLEDRGDGGWVNLTLQVPGGYTLVDPGDARLFGDTLYWPAQLDAGGTLTGRFTVSLPDSAGPTVWQPQVQLYRPGAGWLDYGQLEFVLDVVPATTY